MMPTDFMPTAFVPTYRGSVMLMIVGALAALLMLGAMAAQALHHRRDAGARSSRRPRHAAML